ncbi:MAG: hypothetical protein M1813_009359 [Trichoglossum hirsutum]|nr:MAG: hypothetical protein M1813_009359 [Trichoglossum hirsutum]
MQKSAMVWVPLVAMKKLQPRRRQLGRTTSEVSVAALKEQGRRLAVMLTKDNSANFWLDRQGRNTTENTVVKIDTIRMIEEIYHYARFTIYYRALDLLIRGLYWLWGISPLSFSLIIGGPSYLLYLLRGSESQILYYIVLGTYAIGLYDFCGILIEGHYKNAQQTESFYGEQRALITGSASAVPREPTPVYLVTVNLEQTENTSNYTVPSWRKYLPRNIRLLKHWGVLVHDTVYELARVESSAKVRLSTSHWEESSKRRFDPPEKIGVTSLDKSQVYAIGVQKTSCVLLGVAMVADDVCGSGPAVFCLAGSRVFGVVLELSILLLPVYVTRHIGGTLSSTHVPLHIAKVNGGLIVLFAIACAVALPLYILLYFWPLSLTGILLCGTMEAYYVWQIIILGQDTDDIGGWSRVIRDRAPEVSRSERKSLESGLVRQ